MDGWMDVGWLEKAELKPTQPSLAAQVFGTFQLVAGLFLAMPLMQLFDIVDVFVPLYE